MKHLYILVIWGKKEGKYIIRKSTLFSLGKYFFGYGSVFRVHQNAFQGENDILSFLDVLQCLIHEDALLHALCILDIYKPVFSSLMFLTIILTLHTYSVR